jgi:predicted DNA-binding transcriptional regulator AlpA
MSDNPLPDFAALPDWAVLNDKQTTQLLNLSHDTLRRLDETGEGPRRVQLSPRRHGRTVAAIREWLAERMIAHKPQSPASP